MVKEIDRKPFATSLPFELHKRLRCEAVRTGRPIQEIVEHALDEFIAADLRVVGGDKSTRGKERRRNHTG